MRITFHGAAREVTGSCFLVEAAGARFLVDCGLFQGGREAMRKNREALGFDVQALDFVLLTHAHLDHSGLLPRLVALGCRAPIYTTAATADLLEVMLADAAYIQEREAQWRREQGRPAEPLYTVRQAQMVGGALRRIGYGDRVEPHPGIRCRFHDAGHILGSAIIEIGINDGTSERNLVFSGDLGQPGHPIVRDPAVIGGADVLVVESTYGDRTHKSMQDTLDEFVHAIVDTLQRKGGNVIIPAFAVGRTQDLLYLIVKLHLEGRLPAPDVYVDSPMATAATEVTLKHLHLADAEAVGVMRWLRENRARPRIRFVDDHAESRALAEVDGAIIISASGMCDAGRIKHHLRRNLPREESSIIFTGFQAEGTLGRRIVGRPSSVRIFGEDTPVRADIYTIGGLSAHADRDALLGWLANFRKPPAQTFVVHGEAVAAERFAGAVRERFGWTVKVPAPMDDERL